MERIAEVLARGEYDIVMLEELWVRADHTTIKHAVSGLYHMTEYGDFNSILFPAPWGCSGLAILSKWEFKEKNFTKFTQQGKFGNQFKDGEYWAGKGIGKVTVVPRDGMEIDVFVTHTISDEDNYQIREHQADELIDQIEKSKADFVILGGDFNASPLMDNVDKTYHKVKKHIKSTHVEDDQKLYQCTFCQKGFSHFPSYESHMNSHKNLRPYQCHLCDNAYQNHFNLQQHVKKNHGVLISSNHNA